MPWREGARSNDPADPCPECGAPCMFASDFKKMGKQSVRVCGQCAAVFHNGKRVSALEIHKEAT